MSVVLGGILLVLVIGSYFAYENCRKKDSGQSGPACDRTEDKGFYQEIDPTCLPSYQSALYRIFSLLDASRFNGNFVPGPVREAVEQKLADAAADPYVNPKLLRVMLLQFLQSDVTLRQQPEILARWAERMYELDSEGTQSGLRPIPSAWKVYIKSSMNTETALERADK